MANQGIALSCDFIFCLFVGFVVFGGFTLVVTFLFPRDFFGAVSLGKIPKTLPYL